MKSRLWLVLLPLISLLILPAGTVMAQDKALIWERYDVNITVLNDGDIVVEEIQEISFTQGSFTFGFAAIPLGQVENLTDIQVAELVNGRQVPYTESSSNQPNTFEAYREGDEQIIRWYFTETRNSTHTYVLRYRAEGALLIFDGGDQLFWKAIPPDHNFRIRQGRVTVRLPGSFAESDLMLAAYGSEANAQILDASTVVFNATNIPADRELEVRVQFPHGFVDSAPPSWQTDWEAERAREERARELRETYGPLFDLGFFVLGAVVLVGGPLGLYLLWYTRGRDKPVGLVADYLAEPPDDLPPGLAGTLIDEKADLKDIIATLVDLARRGALRMEEKRESGFLGIGSGRDFIFHLEDSSLATQPYEETLIKNIFKSKETRKMSDLREKFYTTVPILQRQLYDDAVKMGLFPVNPTRVRRIYTGLGIAGAIFSGFGGFILLGLTADYSGMAICPTLALIVTMIALVVVGQHMPRKTARGAEAAARWQAFKRYLQNIEKYGNLEEAKERFDQYLPYAIAFGLERSFIQKFSRVDTPAPRWYGPVVVGHPYGGGRGGRATGRPATAGPVPATLAGEGGSLPSLQQAGESMVGSLQSMGEGLTSMISSVGRTFTSAPSNSGSGGGWSGGGGGGGGSRGFG